MKFTIDEEIIAYLKLCDVLHEIRYGKAKDSVSDVQLLRLAKEVLNKLGDI